MAGALIIRGPGGETQELTHGMAVGRGSLGLSGSTRISRKHLQIVRRISAFDGSALIVADRRPRVRWYVQRNGTNGARLTRAGGHQVVEIDKVTPVELKPGDTLELARRWRLPPLQGDGEPADPSHVLVVEAARGEESEAETNRRKDAPRALAARPAAVAAPPMFAQPATPDSDDDEVAASPRPAKRARRSKNSGASDRYASGGGGGGAASAAFDLTNSPAAPARSLARPPSPARLSPTLAEDGSDDDVIVIGEVRGKPRRQSSDVVVVEHPRLSPPAAAADAEEPSSEEEQGSYSQGLEVSDAPAVPAGAAAAAAPAGAAGPGGAAAAPKVRRGLTRKRPFDCPVCMMECEPDEAYTLSCTHSYCAACIGQYASIKVKDGEISKKQLCCPDEGCKAPLTPNDVEGVLTHADDGAELWAKFDEFRLTRYVEEEDTSHHCPGAGCGYMFFVGRGDPSKFDCPQCSNAFCMLCKEKWHDGSCPVAADESMEEYMKNTTLKQCPNCKNMVEKAEGCNAIACRCGIQFCFICAKQIQAADQRMSAALCQCDDPLVISHRGQAVATPEQRQAALAAQAAQAPAMMRAQMGGFMGRGHMLGGGAGGAAAAHAGMQAHMEQVQAMIHAQMQAAQAQMAAGMAGMHANLMGFGNGMGGAPAAGRGRGRGRRAGRRR